MNRTLKRIDDKKWYHLETLKKYYVGRQMQIVSHRDNANKEFTFVNFKRLWSETFFIVHPKTKRLRLPTTDAYIEIGFVY